MIDASASDIGGYKEVVFSVEGKDVSRTLRYESGGHRVQRIPVTEASGRIHTSAATVAVLPEPTETQITLREEDLEFTACRGSGAGGQHRNVTDSAVQLTHRPSGMTVRCESERSQHQNRETARGLLRARLWELEQSLRAGARAQDRRQQVGSGMRGDKRRTIRAQDGQVVDHVTGRSWRFKDYIRGIWDS